LTLFETEMKFVCEKIFLIAFAPFPVVVFKYKGYNFFNCNASLVSCNL